MRSPRAFAPAVFICGPITNVLHEGQFDGSVRALIESVARRLEDAGFRVLSAHREERFGTAVPEDPREVFRRDWSLAQASAAMVFVLPADSTGRLVRTDGTFIELGWATALGKPLIVVIDSTTSGRSYLLDGLLRLIPRTRILDIGEAVGTDKLAGELRHAISRDGRDNGHDIDFPFVDNPHQPGRTKPACPLILVTNDDGIGSVGLRAAAEAAHSLGEVLIVAPMSPQTGMGRAFPRSDGQGVIAVRPGPLGSEVVPYYAVAGSPAQAVAHAVLEIASRRPALCISGINDGENLGGTSLVSGTIGAASEANGFGIPALAVSIGPEDPIRFGAPYRTEDWSVAAGIIRQFAAQVLDPGLPAGVSLLNINIPSSARRDTEVRTTAQSRQNHYVCSHPGPRDFSQPCRLPVVPRIRFATLEPDSDLHAFFVDRVISVTPMGCDLTIRDANGAPKDVRSATSASRASGVAMVGRDAPADGRRAGGTLKL